MVAFSFKDRFIFKGSHDNKLLKMAVEKKLKQLLPDLSYHFTVIRQVSSNWFSNTGMLFSLTYSSTPFRAPFRQP
jgi:hypothetical protein